MKTNLIMLKVWIQLQESFLTEYAHVEIIWKSDEVEEDEMGGPCITKGEEEECLQIIGGKARGKENTRKTKK
jgi:hypothetical protein